MFCFSRGFGFITFKDINAVEKVLGKDVHMLDEKQVGVVQRIAILHYNQTSV
jgi:hypothetical protein